MIQSYINSITTLNDNTQSVQFTTDCIRTNSCNSCTGWLCHNLGSANYDIIKGGMYEINFNATATTGTAGTVAFQLFNNGEAIPGTLMACTLATAGDYCNIGIDKKILVCCNGNANISVRPVASVPSTTTAVTTQTPIIVNANLSIAKIH